MECDCGFGDSVRLWPKSHDRGPFLSREELCGSAGHRQGLWDALTSVL